MAMQVVVNPPHMRSMGRVYNTPDCRISTSQTSTSNLWCAKLPAVQACSACLTPAKAAPESPGPWACWYLMRFVHCRDEMARTAISRDAEGPSLNLYGLKIFHPRLARTQDYTMPGSERSRLSAVAATDRTTVLQPCRRWHSKTLYVRRACWDAFQDSEVPIMGYAVQAFRVGNTSSGAGPDEAGGAVTPRVPLGTNETAYSFGNVSLQARRPARAPRRRQGSWPHAGMTPAFKHVGWDCSGSRMQVPRYCTAGQILEALPFVCRASPGRGRQQGPQPAAMQLRRTSCAQAQR